MSLQRLCEIAREQVEILARAQSPTGIPPAGIAPQAERAARSAGSARRSRGRAPGVTLRIGAPLEPVRKPTQAELEQTRASLHADLEKTKALSVGIELENEYPEYVQMDLLPAHEQIPEEIVSAHVDRRQYWMRDD